jgi:NAD-dependent dihydropyrimidine dehydrogenase PreA subunit
MTTFTWEGADVTIQVDYDKCKGDGECVSNCPSDVYELKDAKSVPTSIDDCIECCTCVEVCPENAIHHSSCE